MIVFGKVLMLCFLVRFVYIYFDKIFFIQLNVDSILGFIYFLIIIKCGYILKLCGRYVFFFQRFYRCINSVVLVFVQEFVKEMLGIVKKGDFFRLFMKSIIRVCLLLLNKFGYFVLFFDDIYLLIMYLV